MHEHSPEPNHALRLAISGWVSLAIAMGIGRFAFTPLLPIMQSDAGLELAQGGWLASANYLGYLAGALLVSSVALPARAMLGVGLALVVASTALMGVSESWPAWMLWRFIAGVASSVAMVGTATLCLNRLGAMGKGHYAGVVFSGVGTGIASAGLLCLALALWQVPSATSWLVLAGLALLLLPVAWRLRTNQEGAPAGDTATANPKPAQTGTHAAKPPSPAFPWRLILCYGLFGMGYILPATFLPAQARTYIEDPALFGLAWPVFGAAAALSTLLASRLTARFSLRRLWCVSQLIMAVGVCLPALHSSLGAILLAACCVGGTFMVATMTGMQEARRYVPAAHTAQLIGLLTAAFALGQLLGPLVFSFSNQWFGATLNHSLWLATGLLLLSSLLLATDPSTPERD